MKTLFFKAMAVFFVLLVATSLMVDMRNTQFGTVNFFEKHGIFFLLFITIFPRLTLLFSSVATGGFLWWLGFIFCPRILVASLATISYFHTNPILVTLSWVIALGGETLEKAGLGGGRGKFVFRTYNRMQTPEEPVHAPHSTIDQNGVIEAEFTKKD